MAPASGGKIRGIVIDASSKMPIEFSNIALYKITDSTLVTVASSAQEGTFVLENVPKGEYKIKVTFVGYKTTKMDSIKITGSRPVDLGNVNLYPNTTQLDEVVVKGEKKLYETKIDRKVFNVDKALVSQSGNAADVLQQVPSVSVDQDGVVSLRGSENVNILINGRPTLIDKTVLLQQIAANSIEKIEVITNPSVKYDSEGTSGIINIVLKQGVAQGINGTAAVNLGTNDKFDDINKYNGSVNINYNPGKYNLFGGYSFRHDNGYFKGYNNKHYFTDTLLNSNFFGARTRESNMIRLGIDYFVSKSLTLGANGSINGGNDDDNDDDNYSNIDPGNTTFLKYIQTSTGKEDNFSKEFAAYLTKKFETEGHELKVDYSIGEGQDDEYSTTYYDTTYSIFNLPTFEKKEFEKGMDYRRNQIISTDYSLPINEKMKLELGGKLNMRDNHDTVLANYTSGYTITDALPLVKEDKKSYNYKYHEDITSLYSTYSLTLGNFSVMAGVKTEFANYKFTLVHQDTSFNNYFFSFIPSLHMVQKLNDNNEVNLSYSRRINRPRGRELSPILDYSNLTQIRKGNPNLKPEYTNSFEAGYTYKPEKISIQPVMFYRIIENRFSFYRISNPITKIDTVTSINIGNSHSYGFDLAITYSPFKFWNLNISGSVFQYTINATNTSREKQQFSYNGKIMSNTILPAGLAIQLSAFYRSPLITTQGSSDPTYSVNLALKKDLLKGKLVATLNFNDIFNTVHWGTNSTTFTDYSEMWGKRESQTMVFGLTYKFGKAPKMERKKPSENGNDEYGGGEDMMY
jgi:outer membrane receptor protein involved in Fe transport